MVQKQTPMQRQYLQLKRAHPNSILMFRLGDFYEMFNEDAITASRVLDIVLTSRGEGVDRWPMCGVPYTAVESYAAKLLQAGYTVAMADQVEDPSEAKGIVRRDIVRLITPGTVLESTILEDAKNNFLVALVPHGDHVGLSAIDVSTGQFMAAEFPGTITCERVLNEIGRLCPSEILLPDSVAREQNVRDTFQGFGARVTIRNDTEFSERSAEQRLKEHFRVVTLDGFGLADKRLAVAAAGAALSYVQEVHRTSSVTVSTLRSYSLDEYMVLDSTTQRNLELTRNARDGSTRGTLLEVLSETVTPMGKRLLRQWMLQPLKTVAAIDRRLDAIDELSRAAILRKDLISGLKAFGDLERTTSRVVFGTGCARDLLALGNSLEKIPHLKAIASGLRSEVLVEAASRLQPLSQLQSTLKAALLDDLPLSVREGGMIRDGFDEELDRLKASIASDKKWIASLQQRERMRTGIKSLRVGFNKVFGYYIEVTNSNLSQVPDDYERKQTLANAERFVTPELKEKEEAVLAGEDRINRLEYEIYERLRGLVRDVSDALRNNSQAIAVIDVLAALAEVAVTRKYTRPRVTEGTAIRIVDGRHPSLELILGPNEFVPNSLELGDGGSTLVIVTGPNMAGKSTYMRQAALIVLMAQMGSFVPAKEAEIGCVDRIFTRVGAFDDLTARQSTFMVEMIETANILNNATDRSLVVLDEIGRGTSTFDGMALAWAVAERVAQMKTRTLFATHFHQLTDMARSYHGVKNMHTLAKESGDTIVFLHRVVEGGTDKSYGIQVAALAGIPEPVIKRARQLLQRIEKENMVVLDASHTDAVQTSLEPLVVEDPIVERIRHMDLDRTTPMDALLKLREMQDEIKRRG
ncbi:MAG: DNA mismatch repair protein MutS [Candidatus Thorarchaeota archaeon]|nr:DNA mismatch repair protein MutS [Candidatus Thorarchaeota archaeon]